MTETVDVVTLIFVIFIFIFITLVTFLIYRKITVFLKELDIHKMFQGNSTSEASSLLRI